MLSDCTNLLIQLLSLHLTIPDAANAGKARNFSEEDMVNRILDMVESKAFIPVGNGLSSAAVADPISESYGEGGGLRSKPRGRNTIAVSTNNHSFNPFPPFAFVVRNFVTFYQKEKKVAHIQHSLF
jgi:hypothetical protein